MVPTSAPEAILCVDDEGIILMHLVMLLQRRYGDRYRYGRAAGAEEARVVLERFEAEGVKVVLVLSDWLMPGLSGDAFLKALKSERPGIRAILVSGKSDEEEIRRLCEEAGLSGFLSKPISSEELFALIDRIEGERRSPA